MIRFIATLVPVGYFLVLFCLPLVAVSTPSDAKVQFSNKKNFDRVIFEFETPAKFRSQKFGSQILIEFNTPISSKFDKGKRDLGKYIKTLLTQDEGREAVVTMQGKLEYKVYRVANKIILDVGPEIESASNGLEGPKDRKTSNKKETKSPVSVRVGKHKDYERLVFEWPKQVNYSITKSSDKISINFDSQGSVDLQAVRRQLPRSLSSFNISEDKNNNLVVIIGYPRQSAIKHSKLDKKIVLDFLNSKEISSQAKNTSEEKSTRLENKSDKQTIALAEKLGLESGSKKESKDLRQNVSLPKADIKETLKPTKGQNTNANKSDSVLEPEKKPETRSPEPSKLVKDLSINQNFLSDPKWKVNSSTNATAVLPVAASKKGQISIEFSKTNNVSSMRFGWSENVPAAVFTRAGYLWAVFDQEVSLDVSKLKSEILQIISLPQQIGSDKGTVFRAKLVDGVSASVWRDGNIWVVDLVPQQSRPDVALQFVTQQTSPQGPRVFVLAEGIGEAIIVTDPEVGDRLFIVPILPLSRGVEENQTFAQFNLLKSIQGIVIQPLIDELEVRVMPDGVAVTASSFKGLEVSDPSKVVTQKTLSIRSADGLPGGLEPGRIFNLASWRQGAKPHEFLDFKQRIQNQISQATSIARSGPRLSLAQFYFAKGLSAETMGLLRTISSVDEELSRRPDVIALRGASQFILGRFAEAEKELDNGLLNGFSEAELWRGASNAAQGKWAAAIEHFARAGEIPGDYPRNFSTQLALWAAEAAIRAEDYRGAGVFLDTIADGKPTAGEQARLNYLRGRVLYASNDITTALNYWRRLIEAPDRWARVRAQRSLIEHDLQSNVITRTEAIEKLEQLRFAWRGDQLEFNLLRRLGELYLEEKDFVSGLSALRQAVTFFPNNVETRVVSKRMINEFSSIYTDGTADSMTPLTALSMYDQFRELTPVGRRGDRIIQRLADRLVEVDLLDRAAVLLDRQVKFRLRGKQKAIVGSKLALIRLLDRQPRLALDALNESVSPGLDSRLALERKRLRSRSVFELGDSESALKLIKNDDSRKADLLRADIYWRTQDWERSALIYQRLIGDTGKDGRRLSDLSATLVVNWVVSLSMNGQKDKLNEARQVYAAMMDSTRYREAFRLITNKTAEDLQDFRTLTERFQEIGRFQGFLTSYREKLRDQPLSKIQ